MELKDTLLKRRSIRKFTKESVSKEDINIMLHAAMSGPSAVNKTPWEFYVVTNQDRLALLNKATNFSNIEAPLAIVVCGSKSRMLPLQLADFWIQDCSAASQNILLSVTDLGLGAVWCGIYPQKRAMEKVSKALDLPEKHIPLNIIYIGHPDEDKEARDQYKEKYIHYLD